MDRKIFKENLLCTLSEVDVNGEEVKYIIIPICEEGKKHNSTDDYMRLTLFTETNLKGRLLNLEETIELFSGLEPYFPLWIDVYPKKNNIVELQTSLRFRRPSEIHRKETGHPPFKLMLTL
ncbi:MAG: hypothetical protein K2K56_13490 [Lachnospiraceae bacterium]|nr:hypothetical protein [Lachnospiraceae bacterium]